MQRTSRPEGAGRSGQRHSGWFSLVFAAGLLFGGPLKSAFAQTSASGPSPLEITGGLRAVHRSFEYHDTAAGLNTLLSHRQPLGPSAFAQVYVYPSAFESRSALGNLGLAASYELALPTSAVFEEGTARETKLKTHASEFFLGLRGRLPLGSHELGLSAGYGQQRYTLSGDEHAPLVPDVSYEFARVAADASLRFDALTVGLRLGTRFVGDTGGLRRDWFPAAKANSVEGGLLLGYRVAPQIEVVGGFDLTRYWFDFNPIPANADPQFVAGGAVDQYVSGWLGIRFSLASGATSRASDL